MTTPEQRIEKHLKKEVEASGGKVRKLKWIGKSGAPDRLIWWPKAGGTFSQKFIGPELRAAFVELKAPGKKPSKVQEIEHAALRDDGFQVFVVDSIEVANAVIGMVRDRIPTASKTWVQQIATYDLESASKIWVQQTAPYDVKSPPDLPPQDNSDLA